MTDVTNTNINDMKATEIVIKPSVIGNANLNDAMDAVKITTKDRGVLFGINFIKILHTIVLF